MARFNSTKTALTANSSWDTGWFAASTADRIVGSVFADQGGTIYIEQSFDGVNPDISTSYSVSASDGKGFSEEVLAPLVRVRYANGGTNQTAFRLYARLSSAGDS